MKASENATMILSAYLELGKELIELVLLLISRKALSK